MTTGGRPISRGEGNTPEKPVLIYDGECSVCRGAVEWIRRRCAPDTFEFLSCHAEELPRRFPHVRKGACLEAMHLILLDGRVLAGEQAVPEILLRLRRWHWTAALFRLPVAEVLSRMFYRWFSRKRHLWSYRA